MIRFINKKTGETQSAYSLREESGKIFVRYSETGKEYGYSKDNIEILDEVKQLIIYSFMQECYKCHQNTEILTYMVFSDGTNENLIFPWDKQRLHATQPYELLLAHMQNEYIEYYPIAIIGSNDVLDDYLLKTYPHKIHKLYSYQQKRSYPMNICQNCQAKQGEFFIYERLNKIIAQNKELKEYQRLPYTIQE